MWRNVLALLLTVAATTIAQGLGQIQVRLFRPPPNQLRQADLWRVQLTNLGKEPVRLYLQGVVTEARDGEVINARSAVIVLPPGTRTFTGTELSPISVDRVHPRYRELYLRTGEVPAGEYTVCVYARAAETGEELGSDCYEQTIQRLSPPILLQPADGDSIPEGQRPVLSWIPPSPVPPGMQLTYTVRIVEMLGQQSPYDAMQSNPAFFERSGLTVPMLQYPLDARPFQPGRAYAWKVGAYAGQVLLGESEIWSFRVFSPRRPPTPPPRPSVSVSALAAGVAHSLAVGDVRRVPVHPVALRTEYLLDALDRQPTSTGGEEALLRAAQDRALRRAASPALPQTAAGTASLLARIWQGYLKGALYAWGDNSRRQATGTQPALLNPVRTQLTNVVAVAGGYWHTLAVTSDGQLFAWGRNDYGQLGDGTLTDRPAPVQVAHPMGKKFIAVAAGERHSLALDEERRVWAWGINLNRELGLGADSMVARRPVQVRQLSVGVSGIAAGVAHSMALLRGQVWVWGSNFYGQAGFVPQGMGDFLVSLPRRVTPEGQTFLAIAAGDYHCVALRQDGTVWAWGDNRSGQVHPDSGDIVWTPVQVPGLTDIIDIAAGSCFSVALARDSTVWVWGNNGVGTYADGTRRASSAPVRVPGLSGVVRVVSGGSHVLALKADGTIVAWGNNNAGQLGRGTQSDVAESPALPPNAAAPVEFGGP